MLGDGRVGRAASDLGLPFGHTLPTYDLVGRERVAGGRRPADDVFVVAMFSVKEEARYWIL